MKLTLLLLLLPLLAFSQNYDTEIKAQWEVKKESKLIPIHCKNKTLLIDRNVALELKLKSSQEIYNLEDFYYILRKNQAFIAANRKFKKLKL